MRPCKLMRLWSLPKGLQKMASSRVKSAGWIIFHWFKWPPAKMVRSQLPARTGEVLPQHCHDFDISENANDRSRRIWPQRCHEGRGLLDLFDWSKNFDLGIRNQLFFTKKQGAGELLLYKFAIGAYSHWQILLLENHILKCPLDTNSISYFFRPESFRLAAILQTTCFLFCFVKIAHQPSPAAEV